MVNTRGLEAIPAQRSWWPKSALSQFRLGHGHSHSHEAVGLVSRLLPVLVAGVGLLYRSTIDDAYISFRYAHNLAAGHGLVFNPGEHVQGYTNFLWTIAIALPLRLGVSPELFTNLITASCAGIVVWTTIRCVSHLAGDERSGLLAGLLLGTNATFVTFATSGLETMPQTATLMGVVWLVIRSGRTLPSRKVVLQFAALSTLALLLRLDSAVVLAVAGAYWIWSIRAGAQSWNRLAARLAPGVLGGAVIIAPWLALTHAYYGNILPNTFYAKASSGFDPMGFIFVGLFVLSYLLFVPLGLVAARTRELLSGSTALLMGVAATWTAYVIYAGGDWMDFRFMVVAMPALFGLIAMVIRLTPRRVLRTVALASCVVGSLAHSAWQGGANVSAISTLRQNEVRNPPNLVSEGYALRRYFPGGLERSDQVTIAVVSAGAIPYFSELPTIDLVGLNDAHIARHGLEIPYPHGVSRPGHLRIADFTYLRERGCNLVIGLPKTVPFDGERRSYDYEKELAEILLGYPFSEAEIGSGTQVLEIPVEDNQVLLALYVGQHPSIERLIDESGWRLLPIEYGNSTKHS